MKDEQHIMQKTIARNKYPVLEKELELDLDLTSLNESSLLLLLKEFVEMLSPSSKILDEPFDPPGIISKELSGIG
jgi:hypothetical protein